MKTFGKRGTFWSASLVLGLSLWASGASSVLYPVYAAKWDLPPVVTTSVFGVYPLALLVVLLFFGSLSDTIGRRRAILIGVKRFRTERATSSISVRCSLAFTLVTS